MKIHIFTEISVKILIPKKLMEHNKYLAGG